MEEMKGAPVPHSRGDAETRGSRRPEVTHIVVVGFHHQFGPKVEFIYPALSPEDGPLEEKTGLPAAWENLPFLALPDGVHHSEEDHSYFTLPPLKSQRAQIDMLYGVSCFRQVHVSSVVVNTEAYTRTLVQKAVCALANVPLLGSIHARLSLVTRAYFDQGNFEETELLALVHQQLNAPLSKKIEENSFYIGLDVGRYVRLYQRDFLVLFKLLLLEQKILINGTFPVSSICNCLVSLIGLVPGLLTDAHSDDLISIPTVSENSTSPRSQGMPLASSTLSPLERRAAFGFPLKIFDSVDRIDIPEEEVENNTTDDESLSSSEEEAGSAMYQNGLRRTSSGVIPVKLNPLYYYISIRQIDGLREHPAYLAAASNPFFNTVGETDVIVQVDQGKVVIKNKSLTRALSLTPSDRRFIDKIIVAVEQFHSEGTQWEGSDDWIRAQFALYLESFIASLLTVSRLFSPDREEIDLSPVVDFNLSWAKAWLATVNYHRWRQSVKRNVVSSLVAPVHPAGPPTDLLDELSDGVSGLSDKIASMDMGPLRDKLELAKTGFMRGWTKFVSDSKAKGREYLNNIEAAKKQWDTKKLTPREGLEVHKEASPSPRGSPILGRAWSFRSLRSSDDSHSSAPPSQAAPAPSPAPASTPVTAAASTTSSPPASVSTSTSQSFDRESHQEDQSLRWSQ